MAWLSFLAGLMIGGIAGVFAMCLMIMASRRDTIDDLIQRQKLK